MRREKGETPSEETTPKPPQGPLIQSSLLALASTFPVTVSGNEQTKSGKYEPLLGWQKHSTMLAQLPVAVEDCTLNNQGDPFEFPATCSLGALCPQGSHCDASPSACVPHSLGLAVVTHCSELPPSPGKTLANCLPTASLLSSLPA